MKRLALLITFALASCGALNATAETAVQRTPNGSAIHSTVELQTAGGRTFCSGVITDGIVLTAAHCVDDLLPVWVDTLDSGRHLMRVARYHLAQDLAVLVAQDGEHLGRGAKLARSAPKYFDTVWVVGHSMGFLTHSVTRGTVSHPRRDVDGINKGMIWMQHDAGSVGGNSGGPVFNDRGRLVGITSFGYLNAVRCGFPNCPPLYSDGHISGAAHYESLVNILDRS